MKVEFRNIAKKYEGNLNYTLENINLQIDDNDFCIILGPSGCGKTTLLRMIAGLNSITKGDLLFDGKRINDLAPKDRDIAMVFQSYALYPHMNVYKNMAFGLKMRKEKKNVIDRRVRDAAKILNIEHLLYKKPREISGGQRQRVALGRAIVRKPNLFLMDEPLSNLDAKLREYMRSELVKLHRALNSTTIYVTHDQLEAMTMSTKIVLMHNQKIQQIGKPQELYEQPVNLFVAEFIGTPTMNLYHGEIENDQFISNDKKITYKFDEKTLTNLKANNINKITLGIRSEHIKTVTANANCEAKIYNIEILGKDKEIKAQISLENNITLTVATSYDYQIDQNIKLAFEKVHIFNTISGNRVN